MGLMDTDGSCHSSNGQCIYCSADSVLANDVYILCGTLGLNQPSMKDMVIIKMPKENFIRFLSMGIKKSQYSSSKEN